SRRAPLRNATIILAQCIPGSGTAKTGGRNRPWLIDSLLLDDAGNRRKDRPDDGNDDGCVEDRPVESPSRSVNRIAAAGQASSKGVRLALQQDESQQNHRKDDHD